MVSTLGPLQRADRANTGRLQTYDRGGHAPTDPGDVEEPVYRVAITNYSEATSHRLFMACDATGDDRLDLFEARLALEELGDPSSLDWFRRLDSDRDGYIEWPELDRFYQAIVRGGHTLHLRLARPQPTTTSAPEANETSEEDAGDEGIIGQFDTNDDGALDTAEIQKLAEALGLPPLPPSMLGQFDLNNDGIFDATELAPWIGQPGLDLLGSRASGPQLTEPWATIDDDSSGTIDQSELSVALRRIDPQLQRWAPELFQNLDLDGNGSLAPKEFPATTPDRSDG